jgi:hypothetical protein
VGYYKASEKIGVKTIKYHGTVHTSICAQGARGPIKLVKGLAALAPYVIDVTPAQGGVRAFTLTESLWRDIRHVSSFQEHEAIEQRLIDYYVKLYEGFTASWLRMMHNPNIAFVCTSPVTTYNGKQARIITAQAVIDVLKLNGFSLDRSKVFCQ